MGTRKVSHFDSEGDTLAKSTQHSVFHDRRAKFAAATRPKTPRDLNCPLPKPHLRCTRFTSKFIYSVRGKDLMMTTE